MPILPRNKLRGVSCSLTLGLDAALGTPRSFRDRAVTPEVSGELIKAAATFASTPLEYQQSSSGKATMQFFSASSGWCSAKAAAKAALRPLERPVSDRTTRTDKRSDHSKMM